MAEKSIQENLDELLSLLLDIRISRALPVNDFNKLMTAFDNVQESVWDHSPMFPVEKIEDVTNL